MIIVMACLGLTSNDLNEKQKLSIESAPHFASKPPHRKRTSTLDFTATPAFGTHTSEEARTSSSNVFVDVKSEEYELASSGVGTGMSVNTDVAV